MEIKSFSEKTFNQVSVGNFKRRVAAGMLAVVPLVGGLNFACAKNISNHSRVDTTGQESGKKTSLENVITSVITEGGFTNVICIDNKAEGKRQYFKECKQMTDTMQFVLDTVNDYAENFSMPEETKELVVESLQSEEPCELPEEFYEYVKKFDYKSLGIKEEVFENMVKEIVGSLEKSKNIERFFNMDVFWRPYKPYGIYKRTGCTEILGFPKELKNIKNFDFDNFLVYCGNEFNSYYMNKDKKIGETQDCIAEKYALTDVFSKAFGIEKLCVQSKFTTVAFSNGTTKTGVLMDEAPGLSINETLAKFGNNPELLKVIDLNLQKDLTSLQLVDSVLWQVNHMPYNYKIICENDKIKSICCFCHTHALYEFGRTYRPSIKESAVIDPLNLSEKFYHSVSPILTEEGLINLPHISEDLAKKFNEIDIDQLLSSTKIEEKYKQEIKTRFDMIKNAINLTTEKNSNFLIKDNKWNTQAMQEELDYTSKNGKTYFQKLCAFNLKDWWA